MCPRLLAAIWKTAPSILSPELLLFSAGDISTWTSCTYLKHLVTRTDLEPHKSTLQISILALHTQEHPESQVWHTATPILLIQPAHLSDHQMNFKTPDNVHKSGLLPTPTADRGPRQSLVAWPTQCLNFVMSPTSSHPRPPAPARHYVFHQSVPWTRDLYWKGQAELGEV